MIRPILFRYVIIFYLITCFSCNKDSINDERFTGTVQAKINSELVIFGSAFGNGFFDLEKSCSGPFYQILGDWKFNAPNGHIIILNFYPAYGLGTHALNGAYLTWTGPYNDGKNIKVYNQNHFCAETQTHIQEEGSVTIISGATNRYKGTFYFTTTHGCGDTIFVITDGKFQINQKNPNTCN